MVSIATFSSAALVPKKGSQLDETLVINSNDVRTVKSSFKKLKKDLLRPGLELTSLRVSALHSTTELQRQVRKIAPNQSN